MEHNRKIIYLAGFLLSIPVALTSYINSSILEAHAGRYYLGLIYIVASIATIIGMFQMPKILTNFGNRFTTLLFSLLFLLSLVVLALGKGSWVIIGAFILYFVSINFIFTSLDIFLEDFSKRTSIGGTRGAYLTIINLAWVVAQMISGSVIDKSSIRGIYLLSALFTALVCVIFTMFLSDFQDPKYKEVPFFKTLLYFWQKKNIFKIYIINLILRFFYAWMVIYVPIYMHENIGFSWSEIGLIFSVMLLPFVLLEFPLGKLSDTIGEKKMLILGFLIISISTLTIPLFSARDILLWMLVLFVTRIGAATIEIMSESYFFKSVSKENADVLDFFRSTNPLSYIIGPLVAIPVLFVVPAFHYIFYILGIILLIGFLISFRIKDVK